MTRAEYLAGQRGITRTAIRAGEEGGREIRRATREALGGLAETLRGGHVPGPGEPLFDRQALAGRFLAIIREHAAKPVNETRELQDRFEKELGERLGIEIPRRGTEQRNAKPPEDREPVKVMGRALGTGLSSRGVSAYHRDPETGRVIWDDRPLEYLFIQRHDLSTRVWRAVEDMEVSVMSLVRGSIAVGDTPGGIIKNLETYINYGDGGRRVIGRWKAMFPNTPQGRREAWKRQYLAEHGGLQYGTDAAKELLGQTGARAWIETKMAETTRLGTPRLPDAVTQYARRIGSAGMDYRLIRLHRTTVAELVSDEQKAVARNSFISSGKMEWVLERGRDHWNCRCGELAAGGPYDADDPRDRDGNKIDIPLHPNCGCAWRPVLLPEEEIKKKVREAVRKEREEAAPI